MITSISIENFKGIRDRTCIDIRPVTLLFGPNSAGKSTLLHAIQLAREIFSRRNLDVDRTESSDDSIDLGGFLQFVHGRNPESQVTLRFDLDLSGVDFLTEHPIADYPIRLTRVIDNQREQGEYIDAASIGDDVQTGWIEITLGWKAQLRRPYVASYSVGLNGQPLATIESDREVAGTNSLKNLNLWHPLFQWPKFASVESVGAFGVLDYEYPLLRSASQEAYLSGVSASSDELRKTAATEVVHFADVSDFPDDRCYRVLELEREGLKYKAVLYRFRDSAQVRVHSVHASKMGLPNPTPEQKKLIRKIGRTQKNLLPLLKDMLQEELRLQSEQIDRADAPFVRMFEQTDAFPDLDRELPLLIEGTATESEDVESELFEMEIQNPELFNRYLARLPNKRVAFHRLLNRLLLTPGRALRRFLGEFRYVGPVRDSVPRNFEPPRHLDSRRWAGGLAAWEELSRSPNGLCSQVSNWMSHEDGLNTGYGVRVEELREIRSTDPIWLGLLSGRLYDSFDVDDIRKQVAHWPVKRRVVLFSTANNESFLPQDLGQGITQAVPVLAAVLSPVEKTQRPRGGLVAIEQPELHLNPKQQAALGDVFITAALVDPKNRLLLETHSEHLILRIQRRIREAARLQTEISEPNNDGSNDHAIDPTKVAVRGDDVAVYYVRAEDGHTTLKKIDLDRSGEFVQPWPDDFFEIDFYERFA